MSIEMDETSKALLKDKLVNVSEKRVNMSFRVTESRYDDYKHLSDAYKQVTKKSLQNGVIADALIDELNKVCAASIAQVLFNNQPRGFMNHKIIEALRSGQYESISFLEFEMRDYFFNEFSKIIKNNCNVDINDYSNYLIEKEYKQLLEDEVNKITAKSVELFKRKEEQQELPIEK